MTVEKYSELLAKLAGADNIKKYDPRIVLGVSDLVKGQVLSTILERGGSLGGEYITIFSGPPGPITGGVPLVYNQQRQLYEAVLPCSLCLIKKNGAYRYVGPGGETIEYIMVTPNQVMSYSLLEAGQPGRVIGWQEGFSVFFKFMTAPPPPYLTMKLVPSLLWLYKYMDNVEFCGDDIAMDIANQTLKMLQVRIQTPTNDYN